VVVLAVPELADPVQVVKAVQVVDLDNLVNLALGDPVARVDSRDLDDHGNRAKANSRDSENLHKVVNRDLDAHKVLTIRIPINDPGNLKVTAHNKVAPDPSSLSHVSCNAIRITMAN
tara:strand:- start:179 stop:529 length:351 start_codon:yes stop_codon:yes gene_type:complete